VDRTHKWRNELLCDFTILPISSLDASSAPLTWLAIQTLGSHFRSERLKRAAWALGQLPPGSHAHDSESFKWVRQTWSREALRSGSRQVVDLCPGNGKQWPLLRQLKTRMYHPANLALNSELMTVLDEKLRQACTESVQEWCIAVAYELSQNPKDAVLLCDLYCNYMVQVTELQVECFSKTGYRDVLHTCKNDQCPHRKPSLDEVKMSLIREIQALSQSLVQGSQQGQFKLYPYYPNGEQLQHATALGEQCYWLQVSYILLSPAERFHYDCLCRGELNALRAELAKNLGPSPILIWNYLPDETQAWAAKARLQAYPPYTAQFSFFTP